MAEENKIYKYVPKESGLPFENEMAFATFSKQLPMWSALTEADIIAQALYTPKGHVASIPEIIKIKSESELHDKKQIMFDYPVSRISFGSSTIEYLWDGLKNNEGEHIVPIFHGNIGPHKNYKVLGEAFRNNRAEGAFFMLTDRDKHFLKEYCHNHVDPKTGRKIKVIDSKEILSGKARVNLGEPTLVLYKFKDFGEVPPSQTWKIYKESEPSELAVARAGSLEGLNELVKLLRPVPSFDNWHSISPAYMKLGLVGIVYSHSSNAGFSNYGEDYQTRPNQARFIVVPENK